MRKRFQFGAALLAAAGCVAVGGNAWAQKQQQQQHPDRPPQAAHPAPVHPQNQTNTNRPPAKVNHPPAATNSGNSSQSHIAPQANFTNPYRPPNNEVNPNLKLRQQMGVGSPRPWVDTMRDLSPAQRDRVLQNSRAFQNLSPDKQGKIRQQFNQWDRMSSNQRADLREKEQTWRNLSPEQRDHIKNDVLPQMRQMPWDRQQMINQKLGVLRNMPESARNQRLNDPNFTRGMSDQERSVLHDLAHTHVAGTPLPPNE
jgi:hypothetical protein